MCSLMTLALLFEWIKELDSLIILCEFLCELCFRHDTGMRLALSENNKRRKVSTNHILANEHCNMCRVHLSEISRPQIMILVMIARINIRHDPVMEEPVESIRFDELPQHALVTEIRPAAEERKQCCSDILNQITEQLLIF